MVVLVLVLKISTSPLPFNWRGRKCWSIAQKGSAADMLPQFTLQSICDFPPASCASVLTICGPPAAFDVISAKNTLLLVG